MEDQLRKFQKEVDARTVVFFKNENNTSIVERAK